MWAIGCQVDEIETMDMDEIIVRINKCSFTKQLEYY